MATYCLLHPDQKLPPSRLHGRTTGCKECWRERRTPNLDEGRKKCRLHVGEPLFPSQVRIGASIGCRVCRQEAQRQRREKERQPPFSSIYFLRAAIKKLDGAFRYLERRCYWADTRKNGEPDALYTIGRRLRHIRYALKKKEQDLNISPKLILGRLRGYGVPQDARICAYIRGEQLRPKVRGGLWDGVTGVRPNGTELILSDRVASQMGVMLRKGAWPDLYAPEKKVRNARRNLRESQHDFQRARPDNADTGA